MVIRYGIIGCGAIAQLRHIPECSANLDSTVAALADPVQERVRELAAKYDAAAFTDHRKMLVEAKLDAVVVCSPNVLHAPMAIDALRAGKHVLCEKPMATTCADARKMIAAARRARKSLMVAFNERFMPAHVRAREILDSGRVGTPLSFRVAFNHSGPEGWSVDGPRSWFFRKGAAVVGVTGDLGAHKVDLMRWLLHEDFVEVGGHVATRDKRDARGKLISLEDCAFLTLKTTSGIIGSLITSWTNYGTDESHTVIYCTGGVLSVGTDPEHGVIVDYRNGDRELHRVGWLPTEEDHQPSGVSDAFTASIRGRRAPPIDGRDGYVSLDVVLTALQAAREKKILKIRKTP